MPPYQLTVAYTGRNSLDGCRRELERAGVNIVGFGVPVDLGVSAAGSHIFTAEEIALARCGIVNLHLAPLPEYRGRFSAAHALANNDQFYGVTLHYIDEGIDTGPIIAETRWPIQPDDTVDTLRERAFRDGEELFKVYAPILFKAAENGRRVASTPQDSALACYYDRHSLPT